jgi:hypothetical protein
VPIRIEPFIEEFSPAVSAFNARLRAGGMSEFSFPEHPVLDWLPYGENKRLYQRPFVAIDDAGCVRGGYILKRQDFYLGGSCHGVGFLRLPISEGVVNRGFASLGAKLVLHALRQSPLLFCLGMGGMERPLPRLLKSLGWRLDPVPFLFHVVRAARFLRLIPALRNSRAKSAAATVLAFSGLGHIAFRALHFARARPARGTVESTEVPRFGDEVNRIWEQSRSLYGCAAVRDLETTATLYDGPGNRFRHLEINQSGTPAGWAALLDTHMKNSRHFGDLRVGTVVDCDAAPAHAPALAAATRDYFVSRGVDLIVTNQSHAGWVEAFRRAGFLSFTSNYIFAASRELAAAAGPVDACHLTRGDGDGPIHL